MKPNIATCSTLFLLSLTKLAAGDPTYQYKFKEPAQAKTTTSITALNEKKRTVFLMTSSSGIGGATITLAADKWPKHVTLRFRYERGRGFHRLEGFVIRTARLQARGGMQDSGKMPFYFLSADRRPEIVDSPAGKLNIWFEERNNAMEVILPANLLVGAKEVEIGWIDAYR